MGVVAPQEAFSAASIFRLIVGAGHPLHFSNEVSEL
jgi:hypothetical protein